MCTRSCGVRISFDSQSIIISNAFFFHYGGVIVDDQINHVVIRIIYGQNINELMILMAFDTMGDKNNLIINNILINISSNRIKHMDYYASK